MNAPQGPAAPASGTQPDLPAFDQLAADPEIARLLEFEPVAMRQRVNGWSADVQRAFVAALAATGSKAYAATAVGRTTGGIERILKRDDADSLRAAVDGAFAHAASRHGALLARNVASVSAAAPVPRRGRRRSDEQVQLLPEPGQMLNELGEWEDEESLRSRADDARDSISNKLRQARRLYLQEICHSPGKRAAFEILTLLPIDWDKAERCEPQPDEPWRKPNMRKPDMLLTAEAGWLGDVAHGEDKKAELRKAIDAHREAEGLEPVEWEE